MPDEDLLREILQSPLDEERDPAPRWIVGTIAFVAVVVAGYLAVWLFGSSGDVLDDDNAAAGSTTAATGPSSAVVVGEDGGSGTTAAERSVVYPDETRFSQMVAIGGGEVVMFGGFVPLPTATAPLEGTWRFDVLTGAWSVEDPGIAPTPRYGHAMAYHPPTERVVLFGGGTTTPRPCPRIRVCPGPEDDQLWQYDPSTGIWEDMTPSEPDPETWPTPRFGARFAFEPITERLIMFSGVGVFGDGNTPNFWNDTWAYDPVTNRWEDLSDPDESARPPGRVEYGFVWNDESERLLMFGGDGIPGDDDNLWAFDPATAVWEDLGEFEPGLGPKDRWFHLLTGDPRSGRAVLIGGNGSIYQIISGGTIRQTGNLTEVWTWSPAEGWVAQAEAETEFRTATGAPDPETMDVIVYGGQDVWSYDVAVDSWAVLWERPADEDG